MKIYKYKLEITDGQEIEMPSCAKILGVQFQNGELCMWAEAQKDVIKKRKFHVIGTGHEFSSLGLRYIGTVQQNEYRLVWHVYEDILRWNND